MLPVNLLSVLAEYLDFPALVAFSAVNRTYRAAAENPNLWRSECRRVYGCDLEVFGEVTTLSTSFDAKCKSKPWKLILKLCVQHFRSWLDLERHQILSTIEIKALQANCMVAFTNPELPLPVLRREAKGFETVIQEFLAYGLEPGLGGDDPDLDSAFDTLDSYSDHLYQQFESKTAVIGLLKARWTIPSRQLKSTLGRETASSSIASSAGSDCPQQITPLVLQYLQSLRRCAKIQCEYHLRELQEARDCGQLLSDYVRRWAAYSASAQTLSSTHSRFESLFNELYEALMPQGPQDPQFSVIRMMSVLWRRIVFAPLQASLEKATVDLLAELRRDAKPVIPARRSRAPVQDDPRINLLARVVQTFIDFSVTATNIHFIDHSQLLPEGPYKELHDAVVEASKTYLSTQSLDCHSAALLLSSDIKTLQRVFLPVTSRAVATSVFGAYELALWKDYFRQRFTSQWTRVAARLREDAAEAHLNSKFGYFLFQLNPGPLAKASVREFVEFLLAEDTVNLSRITRFNELADNIEDEQLTLEDEELEFRMKTQGLDLVSVQRCEVWDTLNTDLGASHCEQLLELVPKDLLY